MQSKNPFELRTEVLAMAKDYLDKQLELNMEFAKKLYEESLTAYHPGYKTVWADFAPKMYTVEDVMNKAKELYGFVSTK